MTVTYDTSGYIEMPDTRKPQWQPIETAPRDGTDIWVYSSDGQFQANWDEEFQYWRPVHLPSNGCGCCGSDNDPPTHWMHLPTPPKTESDNV